MLFREKGKVSGNLYNVLNNEMTYLCIMKKIRHLLLILVMIIAFGQAKAQNVMILTSRQQSLSAIAGLEAKGDMKGLHEAIDRGLDSGLTVAEIKEALSQLYAYTGFPRSLNALGQLQQVIGERQAAGKTTDMGKDDATVLPKGFNSLKEGTAIQTKVTCQPFNYTFAPREDYYLKAHLFGDIFASKVLSHADREIITVSAISSLPGCEPQVLAHSNGALNMGVKPEELKEIPQVLAKYVGSAEAFRAKAAIDKVTNAQAEEVDPKDPKNIGALKGIETSPWPVGKFNSAFAQYFDGKSYLYATDNGKGPANVTFEPGCRNHWHIHHKAVQVLICVAGRGWYQEWGKPAVEMTPGTVIAIPAEAKHWHGAAKDSWFQHLTYMTNVEEGASNEWLEAVSDSDYSKLP